MYELYDKSKTYELPNGVKADYAWFQSRPEYQIICNKVCAVNVTDNVIYTYTTLAKLAEQYCVEYTEDYQNVLDKILMKIDENSRKVHINFSDSVLKAASFAALAFTDEQAVQVPDLYPEYEVNHAYKKDERFTYNGRLFKVNQAHTSAAQWVPGETGTESLYTNLEMAGDGYLVWTQPTGAHNAYNTGDIVHYPTADDPLYKSLIDGNVWSPDTYPQGWQEYDASTSTEPSTPDPGTETPTKPSEPEYPDFVQPTGAHDAYKKGDIVRYNGKLYQSLIDANAYSPDAYPQGWQEYSEE